METWTNIENPGPGIFVYKNVFKNGKQIIEDLEFSLSDRRYSWRDALVGYAQKLPEYRDCVDFKYKREQFENDITPYGKKLVEIWDTCFDLMRPAVDNYSGRFAIGHLDYWEAFNFIRYRQGQHFSYHSDHGFSYNCTVSLVGYLNDDYEGGGLHFREFDLHIKPDAGDLVIFPSTYLFTHAALPVESGTKYSLVVMLDYDKKYHTPEIHSGK